MNGDWKYSSITPRNGWSIQIIQENDKVKGYWKKLNELWFIGTIQGNKINGSRYLSSGSERELDIFIKDNSNRLIIWVVSDGSSSTASLFRLNK